MVLYGLVKILKLKSKPLMNGRGYVVGNGRGYGVIQNNETVSQRGRHRAARAVKKLHDVCHISNINKTPRSLFLPSLLKITSPLTFCSSIVLLLRIQVSDCLVIPIMSFLFVLATDKTILGP